MKLILIILFTLPNAYSMELVLNGITYNINEYKISNNGQRIVINHPSIRRPATASRSYKIRKAVRMPSSKKPGPFQRLLNELKTPKKVKENYQ